MDAIWQWGIDLIHTIQLMHGPVLDGVFKGITFLGEEEFFLILLPLVFWCVDLAIGARLAFAFLLSTYVNTWLKDLFAHPRPFEIDPMVKLHDAGGYGLPSGHSQSAVVVWGTIAAGFRKTWLWVVVIALMVLIGFSRIYLGVHFPTDVFGGWTVGAIFLAAYLALQPRVEAWLRETGLAIQLALAVVAPLVLLLLFPAGDVVSSMAVLMGMGVGIALLRQVASFSTDGPLWQRGVRFLVGAVGLLAFYLGLKLIFPGQGETLYSIMRFVRYALVGLWAGLGAPWLFLKLRLASNG
ncbi:MAG: hypothetical protein DRI77_11105 [Chloroflexi bacterium]|nr:MAG: hypothetical protein DRI77_11105 [Chloroflexota bacterium]